MADTLNVTKRQQQGSANCRRLRRAGQIPANLYGHGQENVNLALATDDLMGVLRHGGRMVQLAGDVSESALIREVQWDAFGSEVLHVDLTRVSAGELVEVKRAIDDGCTCTALMPPAAVIARAAAPNSSRFQHSPFR